MSNSIKEKVIFDKCERAEDYNSNINGETKYAVVYRECSLLENITHDNKCIYKFFDSYDEVSHAIEDYDFENGINIGYQFSISVEQLEECMLSAIKSINFIYKNNLELGITPITEVIKIKEVKRNFVKEVFVNFKRNFDFTLNDYMYDTDTNEVQDYLMAWMDFNSNDVIKVQIDYGN